MDVEQIIDPSEIFSDRYKLMAAVAVIDVSNNKVPIWEINLTDKIKDIRLLKNSFIAECKQIHEVGDKCPQKCVPVKYKTWRLDKLYEDSCENSDWKRDKKWKKC